MRSRTKLFFKIILILASLVFIKMWTSDVREMVESYNSHIRQGLTVTNITNHRSVIEDITIIIKYNSYLYTEVLETVNLLKPVDSLKYIIIVCDADEKKEVNSLLSAMDNSKIYTIALEISNVMSSKSIRNLLRTKYILSLPIGISEFPQENITSYIKMLDDSSERFLAIPVNNINHVHCMDINCNMLHWTLEYKSNMGIICDAVKGDHAIFMKTKTFLEISKPLMTPFPESFYIQTTLRKMKTQITEIFSLKGNLSKTFNWHKSKNSTMKMKVMYNYFKIKKVIRENGNVEWYGCSRNTSRCFGNVEHSVPAYLMQGKWTPPCCLRQLKGIMHHINEVFTEYNVTYWLEGGSLLGAMRINDIIPWDYDIDVGMYARDIFKCPWLRDLYLLKSIKSRRYWILDPKGYMWERSSPEEGCFFRVHSSYINRLHVDIFPFYSRNGTMTKDYWFADHPQDREFPEHYLRPLSSIKFAGIMVPAPNNIREYLEFKFGEGCIENPQYPNPNLVNLPVELRKLAMADVTEA